MTVTAGRFTVGLIAAATLALAVASCQRQCGRGNQSDSEPNSSDGHQHTFLESVVLRRSAYVCEWHVLAPAGFPANAH